MQYNDSPVNNFTNNSTITSTKVGELADSTSLRDIVPLLWSHVFDHKCFTKWKNITSIRIMIVSYVRQDHQISDSFHLLHHQNLHHLHHPHPRHHYILFSQCCTEKIWKFISLNLSNFKKLACNLYSLFSKRCFWKTFIFEKALSDSIRENHDTRDLKL